MKVNKIKYSGYGVNVKWYIRKEIFFCSLKFSLITFFIGVWRMLCFGVWRMCGQHTDHARVWQMAEALSPSHQKTSRDNMPNLVRRRNIDGKIYSRSPGTSSNVEIPLSARSSSGFWISRASSRTFLAFDIFPAGIHDTGAWFIARAHS